VLGSKGQFTFNITFNLSAQVSTTATFNNLLGAAAETVTDLGNDLEQVTIRSTVSAAVQPVQFLRIRLTQTN